MTRHWKTETGSALLIVLAMVIMMIGLVITVFVAVTGERRSSASRLQGAGAAQLASSSPHLVIAQIQDAAASGDAWATQPGMVRTYGADGTPAGVYKLYSALRMFAPGGSFDETEDAPPTDWNAGNHSALFCDLNRPVALATGEMRYPIADPTLAATYFSAQGDVPGYQRNVSTTPGYNASSQDSPENNPLPMPVRWIYILENGGMAVPESVAADGTVVFSANAPQPEASNPVVGRIAFWADDDTCKLNINTAGYARNEPDYWTYWDTPLVHTQDENNKLSYGQPWTNEYTRYPGHPATTGLNVVFDSLDLSDEQILSLTPRYQAGGTRGGSEIRYDAPTPGEVRDLRKNERLFASVDEMFYDPERGANAEGISRSDLEARRFLLTTSSRAPETTLFNTPRATIWPTWQTATKRTPIDKLIAFTSTIAGEPFYFVRENPLLTNELLGIEQNRALWDYLQSLSGQDIPGFGGNFRAKYGAQTSDQILTSIFDAIRLTNLDDRSGPGEGETTGWSYTAGALSWDGSAWVPGSTNYAGGFVAPTEGPSGTRGAGRAPALGEVALLLARTETGEDPDEDGIAPIDRVKAAMLYGFFTPSAGMVQPGQRRRVVVTGLSDLRVRLADDPEIPADPSDWQQIFTNDSFDRTEIDSVQVSRRFMGGRLEWSMGRKNPGSGYGVPPSGDLVLPFDPADPNANLLDFSGGTITVQVYVPETAIDPLHTYVITFPPCQALTPEPVVASGPEGGTESAYYTWVGGSGRWSSNHFEERITGLGDTLLAMQSPTGDYRSEVLRSGTIDDFQPHRRYGHTDILDIPDVDAERLRKLSRRASSLKWQWRHWEPMANKPLNDVLFGRLIAGFNNYQHALAPWVPSHVLESSNSIQEAFPPGDFNNGPGIAPDGSLSPKSDEGAFVGSGADASRSPYFLNPNITIVRAEGTLASPNRQVPSAIYFGSIPTGEPWRTLLFRPARGFHMGGTAHFGASSPPDYLLLDWFHMPVAEPYAISEPFSTAGKINLNAHIMPFSGYLRRETALHALLQSARITGIPEGVVAEINYARTLSAGGSPTSAMAPNYPTRHRINSSETLDLLRTRFEGTDGSGKRAYLTNAEICSVDLVPVGFTKNNLASFWADKRTTGDNSREAPYSVLLPRLTAKSNTFTVHVTAQTLQTTEPNGGWREGQGTVASEWRGSFAIERYIDPNDARFDPASPEYEGAEATNFLSGNTPVEPFFKFRLLGEKRFDP